MHEPVVVQAALGGTGAGASRDAMPHTDRELVADALAAWNAGAAVIGIDPHRPRQGGNGTGSCAERLVTVVGDIRAAGCDAIVGLSDRSCGPRCDSYGGLLELGPELAPLECVALDVVRAPVQPAVPPAALAEAFRKAGTAPELRCSSPRDVRAALSLRDAGLLDDPLRFELVVDCDERAAIEQVTRLTALIPPEAIWSARTRGLGQLRLNLLCMIAGGHVKTGLEDSPWLVQDVPATNEQLVERVVRIVDDLDRPLATPDEAREIFHLAPSRGEGDRHRHGSAEGRSSSLPPIDLRVASR